MVAWQVMHRSHFSNSICALDHALAIGLLGSSIPALCPSVLSPFHALSFHSFDGTHKGVYDYVTAPLHRAPVSQESDTHKGDCHVCFASNSCVSEGSHGELRCSSDGSREGHRVSHGHLPLRSPWYDRVINSQVSCSLRE